MKTSSLSAKNVGQQPQVKQVIRSAASPVEYAGTKYAGASSSATRAGIVLPIEAFYAMALECPNRALRLRLGCV